MTFFNWSILHALKKILCEQTRVVKKKDLVLPYLPYYVNRLE